MAAVPIGMAAAPIGVVTVSLDCHFYDGKLSEQMKRMDQWLDTMYHKHHTEYLESQPALMWFTQRPQLTSKAKSMLDLINRHRSGNVVMIDGEKWDVFILFPPLHWICSRYTDLLPIVNEQLEDMVSGSCPQGRLYRIMQVCMVISAEDS